MTLQEFAAMFLHGCPVRINDGMQVWDINCFLVENPTYAEREIDWMDYVGFSRQAYLQVCLKEKGKVKK